MTLARSNGVLVGTDESSGASIAAGATGTAAEVDVLGDNTSRGMLDVFLCFTLAAVPTSGHVRARIEDSRASGKQYQGKDAIWDIPMVGRAAAQHKFFLGRIPTSRIMKGYVTNGSDKNLTVVTLSYVLVKET